MNSARFKEVYEGLTARESGLMALKGNEYASDDEKLQNFIQAALIEGRRPSQVAMSYLIKHMLSIQKAVETEKYDLYWEQSKPNGDRDECIVQRVADMRNYAVFVLCCLEYEREMPISFDTLKPKVMTPIEKALAELWTPSLLKSIGLSGSFFEDLMKVPKSSGDFEITVPHPVGINYGVHLGDIHAGEGKLVPGGTGRVEDLSPEALRKEMKETRSQYDKVGEEGN